MSKYIYAMLERPPGPGAQPRDGLVEATEKACFVPCGPEHVHVWGFATYGRELTKEECDHYQMFLSSVV